MSRASAAAQRNESPLERRRPSVPLLAALTALACGSLIACGQAERGRILLVGIDGATLQVVGPMIEQGRLPQLAGLALDGASGRLRAFLPLHSPRIWNTIATGKRPEQHGIKTFFYQRDGRQHLYLATDRKVHGLWKMLSDHGLRVGVVNWWTTYPPELVRGVIVSDHFIASSIESVRKIGFDDGRALGSVAHPRAWEERALSLLESGEPLTDVPDPFAHAPLPHWADVEYLSELYRNDSVVVRVAMAIDDELRPDLLMVYLPGTDRVSHVLWGTLEPADLYPEALRPGPAERVAGAEALRRYYEYVDALLGLLLARFGPDDLIVVVSDHGFEAGTSLGKLTGIHDSKRAALGVVFARGPGIEAGADAEGTTVEDIVPTVLAWRGMPIAADLAGEPAAFLDREETRSIATYETTPREHLPNAPSGGEEGMIEELRALGYGE